jgi:hypothetical protein
MTWWTADLFCLKDFHGWKVIWLQIGIDAAVHLSGGRSYEIATLKRSAVLTTLIIIMLLQQEYIN